MSTATEKTLPPTIYNLPNQLTFARLVLSLVLFVLIAVEAWIGCIVVFAVAAATDWLDGYYARKLGLSSALGRVFDPLVDKVMICGAYIFLLGLPFARTGLAPWMVTLVVARELVINGLRGWLESLGAAFGADWLGKIKMGLQCAVLLAVFAALHWQEPWLVVVRDICIWAMLAATAGSGLQYLAKAASLLPPGDGRTPPTH